MRKAIWKGSLDQTSKSYKSTVTEAEIALLAQKDMNGREIKNIIDAALRLAKRYKTGIAMSHIKTVLEVTSPKPMVMSVGHSG